MPRRSMAPTPLIASSHRTMGGSIGLRGAEYRDRLTVGCEDVTASPICNSAGLLPRPRGGPAVLLHDSEQRVDVDRLQHVAGDVFQSLAAVVGSQDNRRD